MKKRVLSILLCVIMLCSLLPTAALATTTQVDFQVSYANGASGTVSYRFGDSGDFVPVTPNDDGAASIVVPSEATSVTVKALPDGEYKVNQQQSGIRVNGNNTLTTDGDKTAFFAALVGESGYTYMLTEYTPQFVIEFDNNDGTGGNGSENGGEESGESNPPQGPSIAFDVDEESGDLLTANNGTFTFSNNGTQLGTFTVTLVYSDSNKTVYAGDDVSISLENANSVEIVMTPAEGQTADLITGGDTPEGALTGPVFDETAGTYTYTVDPSKFNNNFLAMGVWFGTENSGNEEDFPWYTVSYGNSANVTTENGSVTVERIHCGENIFTNITSEVDEAKKIYPMSKLVGGNSDTSSPEYTEENDTLLNYKLAYSDGDIFIAKDTEGVSIDYKFIPDYGYQVTNVFTNEEETNSLLDSFAPGVEISSFTFNVRVNENVHFHVKFTKTEDITDVTGAENVSAATIDDGGNNITDSGNLKLNVADLSENDLNTAKEAFADELESTDDADNIMYLDVDLFQIVSKGENNGYWETQLTDLGSAISVTLNVGAAAGTEYYVIRQHTEQNGTVTYTREQATNNGDGTITFTTDQFSTYAIGYTPGNDGDDTPTTPNIPSVPSIPTTPDTPTNDEIDIPISGDDETIRVGATVSGDTVTVDEIDMDQLDGVLGSEVSTGTVTIDFSEIDSTASVTTVELPANVVKEIAEAVNDPENDAESLEIVMPSGVSITFDADALSEKVSQADGADITISIESHEDADLTDAQKDAVGSRPAFDINVTSGGKHISDMGGKITVGAPYELKPNEKENGLVVWYVDDESNRERCQGRYDPVNKRMNWETDHLSLYMIDYCPTATFADLNIDAWYADSTDFVIENGLMNGYSDNTFRPNNTCTRAMIVTILWRLEGSPIVNYAMDFEDVGAEQWYTEALRWAASNKIAGGYGNGKFGTNDAITREQMVTIMFRYAKYKGYDVSVGENTNILSYGDAFDVAEWAIPAMQWACGSGVIRGIADGSTMNLRPRGNATRAQAAAILQRYCENVANEK